MTLACRCLIQKAGRLLASSQYKRRPRVSCAAERRPNASLAPMTRGVVKATPLLLLPTGQVLTLVSTQHVALSYFRYQVVRAGTTEEAVGAVAEAPETDE